MTIEWRQYVIYAKGERRAQAGRQGEGVREGERQERREGGW